MYTRLIPGMVLGVVPNDQLSVRVAHHLLGSLCCLCSLFAALFIPETKGRSLEELDELFDLKVTAWRFGSIATTGAGHTVAIIENEAEKKTAVLAEQDEASYREQPEQRA